MCRGRLGCVGEGWECVGEGFRLFILLPWWLRSFLKAHLAYVPLFPLQSLAYELNICSQVMQIIAMETYYAVR